MTDHTTHLSPSLKDKTFRYVLAGVSLAFAWILWPFYGAIFWAMVIAILFTPLFVLLLKWTGQKPTLAALMTLAVVVVMVVLPLAWLGAALVREGAHVFQKIQSGEINFGVYFEQILGALPSWISDGLDRLGLGNLGGLQKRVGSLATQGSQFLATQAIGIGQNTFDFVMAFFITLYLAFFLLRDGRYLSRRLNDSVMLDSADKEALFGMFTTVIRATVKGNVVVALTQGFLGGLAFWVLGVQGALLWSVLMAVLSLLPAVGAALVWGPVAVYFLVTGALWQGIGLFAYGVLVIGLVDNVLRPILVGKDTKMPDYVVLMSTLGGMAIFGLNGFVIGPMIAAMFMAVWGIFLLQRATVIS
jgi:predicted PurR-regulated permease PerM